MDSVLEVSNESLWASGCGSWGLVKGVMGCTGLTCSLCRPCTESIGIGYHGMCEGVNR